MNASRFEYLLQLADNALILGQRNSEWTAHGPVLEQDIAITNIALDLLGQARNCYQYAADIYNEMSGADQALVDHLLPRPWKAFGRTLQEDDLAFLRDEQQYRNLLITELPRGDWAFSILRQFFFSAFQLLQYTRLQQQEDARLSAIAEKSVKEVSYHLRWSSEWVIRLGDGTEESRRRMEQALEALWMFTGEMFEPAANDPSRPEELKEEWTQKISAVFDEATLAVPKQTWMQHGGRQGKHTEHLGYLLAEMQYLQRTYPNQTW